MKAACGIVLQTGQMRFSDRTRRSTKRGRACYRLSFVGRYRIPCGAVRSRRARQVRPKRERFLSFLYRWEACVLAGPLSRGVLPNKLAAATRIDALQPE